jgi:hypothetical protein
LSTARQKKKKAAPNKQIMTSNDHIIGLMCHGMAGERLLFYKTYSILISQFHSDHRWPVKDNL